MVNCLHLDMLVCPALFWKEEAEGEKKSSLVVLNPWITPDPHACRQHGMGKKDLSLDPLTLGSFDPATLLQNTSPQPGLPQPGTLSLLLLPSVVDDKPWAQGSLISIRKGDLFPPLITFHQMNHLMPPSDLFIMPGFSIDPFASRPFVPF